MNDNQEPKDTTKSVNEAQQPRKQRVGCGSIIGLLFILYVVGQVVVSLIPERRIKLNPDEIRLQEIVRQVVPYQDQCRNLGQFKGPILGKCLIWWLDEDRPSAANRLIPSEIQAAANDSEVTVFLVSEKDYVSGVSSPRTQVDICVVYWPEKKPAGAVALAEESGIPGVRAKGMESHMARRIATWVESLRVK